MDNPFAGLNQHLLFIKESLVTLINLIHELRDNRVAPSNEDRYIDKKEASRIASVSLSTIDAWRRSRKIMPYYFDTAVRFRYDEFMTFLESRRIDRSENLDK